MPFLFPIKMLLFVTGVAHKPRKYNKSGLPRKTKKSVRLVAEGGEEGGGDAAKKGKCLAQCSSADDDKSLSYAAGDVNSDVAEQSQSNLLDTTASSLNNTLAGAGGVAAAKKRKYVKRKRPEGGSGDAANDASTPGMSSSSRQLSALLGDKCFSAWRDFFSIRPFFGFV